MSEEDAPPPVPPRPNESVLARHQSHTGRGSDQSTGSYENNPYQNVGHSSQSPHQPPFNPASSAPYTPANSAPYNQANSAAYNPAHSAPYNPANAAQYYPTSSAPYTAPNSAQYVTSSAPYTTTSSAQYTATSSAKYTATSSAPYIPDVSQYPHLMYQQSHQAIPSQQLYGMTPPFQEATLGVPGTHIASFGEHQGAHRSVPSGQSTQKQASYVQSPQRPVPNMQSPRGQGQVQNVQPPYGAIPGPNLQPPNWPRTGPNVQPHGPGQHIQPHVSNVNMQPLYGPIPARQSSQGPVQPRSEQDLNYQGGNLHGLPMSPQESRVQNLQSSGPAAFAQQSNYPWGYSQHIHGNTTPEYIVQGFDQTVRSAPGPMQFAPDHRVPDVISSSGSRLSQTVEEPTRIVVGNLPHDCSHDTLENYFENPRNFGGDIEVEHVDMNEYGDEAVVTFKDPSHTRIVLDTHMGHQPCRLDGQTLSISLYHDYSPGTGHNLDTEGHVITTQPGSSTIEVRGFKETTTLENLELYFENSRRSNGGPIQKANMDAASKTAQISFKEENVVSRVLEKTHTLGGCTLTVTKVQLSTTDILLSGIPPAVSDELLENFIEGRMDMDPVKIRWSNDRSKALVQMDSEIDFEEAEAVCNRRKLCETTISVGRVPITNCIRVSNLPDDVTEDLLLNYFENTRRSHGGPVASVELHGMDGLVFFKNSDDVRTVCATGNHTISKTTLNVEPFYTCLSTLGNTDMKEGPQRKSTPRSSQLHDSTKTVEVSGFDISVTHDMIENYFENTRRSGGGKVDNVTINKDECVALVTFAKKSDFEAVTDRKHTLEGRELNVKPLILSKTDLLLTGIPGDISEDMLSNYIAAKLRHEPVHAIFNEDKTKAVVQFRETVDFGKAVEMCNKYPIEGTHIKVSQVPVTNAVIVTNLPEGASADSYKYYFENTTRSGGGDVEYVDMHEDEGYCLVYFKDIHVVPTVCERNHDFDKQTLKVKPYQKCLGLPAGVAVFKFKPPEPLQLIEINPHIVKFLKCTPSQKQVIEGEMSKHFAHILWEKTPLCVECTLSKEVSKCKELAKSWNDDVMGVLDKFTDFIDVKQCNVDENAWKGTMHEFRQMSIEHPDEVTLINDEEKRVITLVARRNVFEPTWLQIQQAVKKAKANAETVTKDKNLDHWKVKYLLAIDFHKSLETQYDNLKVALETGKSPKIRFKGPEHIVNEAQLNMHAVLEDVKKKPVDMEAEKLRLLQNEDIKEDLEFRMKERRLLDVWQVNQDKLMLYGDDHNDLKGMENIIRNILVKFTIPLDDKSSKLLDSAKWKDTKDELDRTHPGAVIIKVGRDAMEIFTTDYLQDTVFACLKDFMSKNTIYKEEVTFNPYAVKFMREHMQRDIDSRMKDVEPMQTHVIFSRTGTIVVNGTTDGIKAAKRILNDLQSQVVGRPHQKKYRDIQKYMASPKGAECIRKIETSTSCVVELLGKGATANKFRGQGSKSQMITESTPCASVTLRSGVKVIVMGGDMTSVPVDMMVNSANNHLKHAGGLAAVIVKKGGRVIQEECDIRVKQSGSLSDGEVFVSTAGNGNLPCKAVAHAVGPRWKGGNNNEKRCLQAAVTSCLKKAEDQKCTSIAIPALSMGMFHYPPDKACSAIVQAVNNHFKGAPSCIGKVYLCDISPDILKAFVGALEDVFDNVTIQANLGDRGARGHSRGDSSGSDSNGDVETIYTRNVTFGRTSVRVVKGELAQEKADVIVNSTSKDLHLKRGRSSAALLSKGGYSIQKECENNYPKGIQAGEVAVTKGGKLSCTDLFHMALNMFEGKDSSGSMQDVDQCVTACLDEAHSRGHKSIALPAVGTGAQRYPKDKVAATMFNSVHRFCTAHTGTSVQLVKFVIFSEDHDTYKAFSAEEMKWSKQGNTSSGKGGRGHAQGADWKHRGPDVSKIAKIVNVKQDRGEFKLGPVSLLVYKGDITTEDTDGILASCNMELDLTKGAVTKALVDQGGQEIVQKCNEQKSKMKNKGIVVTSAGQLQTKWIIFVDTKRRTWAWKPVVVAALKKAEKHQMNTLALPAVGTSVNLRPGDMANVILTAIAEFIQDPPTNLHEIRIVIFKEDMVSPFLQGMQSAITAKQSDRGRAPEKDHSAHGRQRSNDSNVCQMKIYTNEKSSFDRAVRMFNTTVEDEWHIKDIDDPAVLGLTDKQIGKIKHDAKSKGVSVEVDQDVGGITLIGHIGNVMTASEDIHRVLYSHERNKSESEHAKLMSNVVKWYYVVNGKEMPFPAIDNLKIENAHSKKETSVKVKDHSGGEYVLDLVNMVEHDVKQPNAKIPLKRLDLRESIGMVTISIKQFKHNHTFITGSTVAVPKHWKPMKKTEQVLLVPLSPSDQEYQTALTEFTATLGRTPTIISIERLQNPTLYAQYAAKRKEIELRNSHRTDNERILWHGTGADTMRSVNIHGFNRSYGRRMAYGDGVYFAVNSQYSDGGYSSPDANGHKRMYRCQVMTGDSCAGQGGMKVPPPKATGTNAHILYDSVTGPAMYIIFHDCQAYPLQIITYT